MNTQNKNALIWFKRDMRIANNPALQAATACSGVLAVYLLEHDEWQKHGDSPRKIALWLQSLQSLSCSLRKLNIPLLIRSTGSYAKSVTELVNLCKEYKMDFVFGSQEYEWDEAQRDAAVVKALSQPLPIHSGTQKVQCTLFASRTIIAPGSIFTQQGTPYTVFTPYKKAWMAKCKQEWLPSYGKECKKILPVHNALQHIPSSAVPTQVGEYSSADLPQWLVPGEQAAIQQLDDFLNTKVMKYHQQRDIPAAEATSQLSAYVTAGLLGGGYCMQKLVQHFGESIHDEGALVWLNELIWRDFYTDVLFHFPHVAQGKAFKLTLQKAPWRHDELQFAQWKEGATGYPLVDAAMRQLKHTGFMHNRLRMVAAMFLTKHLLIDWRWGEQYFMEQLVDGDFASNNGGWQWSASTGTDAVPYFRIFNPSSQLARFDAQGLFVRKWLGDDWMLLAQAPIVEHRFARERALRFFKSQ
jgi:deoxyribodipyrimidine photo-lyase